MAWSAKAIIYGNTVESYQENLDKIHIRTRFLKLYRSKFYINVFFLEADFVTLNLSIYVFGGIILK